MRKTRVTKKIIKEKKIDNFERENKVVAIQSATLVRSARDRD